MLVPIRMGTNMAAGNQQKPLSLSFSNTRTLQIAKFSETSHFFNQHDSSLRRHVNAASLKGLEIQA